MQDTEQIEAEEEVADEALPQNEDEASEQESEETENPEPKLNEEESSEKPTADDLEEDKGEEDLEKPEEEELIISIDGEESPEKEEPAPKWVKDLRKKNREQAREIKNLQTQIQEAAEKKDQPIELGKKPTPEDFDYDAEATANAIVEWNERKRKLDEQAATKKKQQEEQDRAYQEKLAAYTEVRGSLKVDNYEEAEETAREALNATQQSIIIQGAKSPAHIVYALGRSPQKLKQLSEIKDPIQFAMELARLEETKMKVTKRTPPPPGKIVKGTAPISGSVESTLAKLEAEADRTGDRTKVIQYKRKLKNQTK